MNVWRCDMLRNSMKMVKMTVKRVMNIIILRREK